MNRTFYGKEEIMFYLVFAAFFVGYLILGWFTTTIEMTSVSAVLCIVFILTNIYMFWKEKKKQKDS
ncbi:hypothetical protein HLI_14875 [Halobacillus litoralis]|uniref:Uncharacterized protein n=2 Tax=Bacillaceae TaxID=186817 RepID=A0A410MFG3_9BACI|nr:hypothetical protein HLI_14875 [Halobacillus litoralis]